MSIKLTKVKKLEYVKEYIKFLEHKAKNNQANGYDMARLEAFNWILYEYNRMSTILEASEESFIGEYNYD